MGMKNCTRCQTVKPHSEFSKNKRQADGLSTWCKACSNAYVKEWRTRPTSQKLTAEYKATNYEKQLAQQQAYRDAHRDEIRAKRRADYHNDIEAQRQRHRDYYAANADRKREQQRRNSAARKKRVIDHYGGCCACCGETEIAFLCMDHINGGGNEHRRQVGVGNVIYWWIVKNDFPEGFQVLCWNCNSAKHWYGVCPHERSKAV